LEQDTVAKARGTSKKKAEERAAKRAYYKLQRQMQTHNN
jgi:ribonuclease-3